MATSNLESYTKWLRENAFWNEELLDVKPSPIGGVGVFWTQPQNLSQSLIDTILLRVHKSNILSCKNSLIYNLLVDYQEIHGDEESMFDLTRGMHGLIISFIYELDMGQASPWYDYLKSIDPEVTGIDVPMCLWSESERKLLQNTECSLLGMLDLHELIVLFEECIQFSKSNEKYVKIPEILDIDLANKDKDNKLYNQYKKNLSAFGACVQTVISKAFQVDEYHGPSLVPGADLFNHLSPLLAEDEVSERENVHFVCDGGMDVCEICGEQDCEHMMSDQSDQEMSEMGDQELEELSEEDMEELSGQELSGEEQEVDSSLDDTQDVIDMESSEEEGEEDETQDVSEGEEEEESSEEEIGEITMELIEKLEQEQEQGDDEDKDSENEGDEENEEEGEEGEEDESQINNTTLLESLDPQLQDSSECADIALIRLPTKEYSYEVFNTYGNELADPYLLQRYGFVCSHQEPNVNNSVLLFNQVTTYINKYKHNNTSKKVKQLETKLEWLEANFDILCEIVSEFKKYRRRQQKLEEEDEDEEEEEEEDDDEEEEEEDPDSWQLAFKVQFDGSFSIYSIIILRLFHLPYNLFKLKLLTGKQSKLTSRVDKYLLSPDDIDETDMEINQTLTKWCKQKLDQYPELPKATGERMASILNLIELERDILERAIES